ncbi:MAG TPA: hypothetical protein VLA04_01050 [Verrucomicrobiae bacterium]|nr:hypothetical protein [Verrucomicrobiae bacterium]
MRFVTGLGIFVVCLIAWLLLSALGLFGRSVETASEMADQTVFSASKHVYSHEEFIREKNSYEQYDKQEKQAEAELDKLAERKVTSGTEYDNLVMEKSGARQMKNNIAARYNAMSETSYKAIWKQDGLPKRLGD